MVIVKLVLVEDAEVEKIKEKVKEEEIKEKVESINKMFW